jgi:threonine/homoserine/homoserine lactone efflux protein
MAILYLLFKGMSLGFSIAAPIGPIGILCIRRTLQKGKASGFISGLGASSASFLYGITLIFGFSLFPQLL